ncbi:MAG: serine/threonine-protein kinase [Archangium sp.]|nr:serine/threonine-protein kinase [Archangium sp.]MDP3156509.1 serine/threonine-protein kinase [Archangium sp.]MDP3571700.1 serine/threonine-protein kinase [Archangium sp.]
MSESLGRYRLLKLLATGGMGEVFLARQEGPAGFTKTVVIKRILRHLASDQNFIDLFLNEAKLAAQLQHPHIAQVFGLENEGNTWFISMEYVHGRSLRDIIGAAREQGLKVPPRIAARLASQALQGLHFAHELTDSRGRPLGILHRDVSPENLLVAFTGVVKLVDFGIAKAMSGAVTRVGRPKGKLSYMAPELTISGAEVDRRADVFAMGIVLSEALTLQQPPNTPKTLEEAQGQRQQYQPDPSLPKGLNDILTRAMSPEIDGRFTTAAAMSEALEAWLMTSAQTVVPGDIVGFLAALFGNAAIEANAGVALDDGVLGTTGVLAARRPGTQPLSIPSLQPVRAISEPLPQDDGPQSLIWPILVGSSTALLVGFVLLLALWPRAQPPMEVEAPPVPAVAREVVIPSQVEFDAPLPVELPDAGAQVKAPAKPKPPVKRAAKTGKVTVRVNPWAQVMFGGKNLGTTPLPAIDVPAGTATFVLKNDQLGVTRKVSVKVPAGGSVVLKADLFKK